MWPRMVHPGAHTLSRVTHNSRFQLMCKKQAHFKKKKKIMCNVQVHTKHEILTHVQISVYHFWSILGHVHVFWCDFRPCAWNSDAFFQENSSICHFLVQNSKLVVYQFLILSKYRYYDRRYRIFFQISKILPSSVHFDTKNIFSINLYKG